MQIHFSSKGWARGVYSTPCTASRSRENWCTAGSGLQGPLHGKVEQITYWLMANPKGAARTFSGNSNVAPQTCLQRKALRRSGPPRLWLIPHFVVA